MRSWRTPVREFVVSPLLVLPALVFAMWVEGASASSAPSPELVQVRVDGPAVVLRCRAPVGHSGRLFRLYRVQELVNSVLLDTFQEEFEFVLQQGTAAETGSLYCCQYDNSMYSPYTRIVDSTRAIIPPPRPPRLSVEPTDGRILPGQVLAFQCQAPPTSPPPVAFLLRRQPGAAQDPQTQQSHLLKRSSSPQFLVGPVGLGEEGVYTCIYQLDTQGVLQDSAPSLPVSIALAGRLPVPQLSWDKDGALVCTGSPFYPGAHFSLFPQGGSSPVATRTASVIKHSVHFTLSALQTEGGGYQCQYSVLLGKEWAQSERSAQLTVFCTTGPPPCSRFPEDTTDRRTAGAEKLPLVIGSISAALLFLLVVITLGFIIYKHVKAAAIKNHQREQDKLWQKRHTENHAVDLPLPRVSVSTMEFGAENGRFSVSEPIYDYPLSTFTKPPYN